MADNLMYIPDDDTYHNPFWRLQVVVETFEKQINKSTYQN